MESFSIFDSTVRWANRQQLNLESHPSVSSTNDLAKERSQLDGHGAKLYLTDQQSAGRGRGERHWSSPQSGHGLLSSWCFSLPNAPQPTASPLIGLALYQSLKKIWPDAAFSLKAPNDILLEGRKIAGILIEIVSQGPQHRLIVGLGLNVFSHPSEVPEAGHLLESHAVKTRFDLTVWSQFLNRFYESLHQTLPFLGHTNLNSQQCRELKLALNANPHLPKPYIEVTPNCELKTESGLVPWL